MLPHPTHNRLIALGLVGMAKALEEQRALPTVTSLTFEERLGLLVDREAVERESKRLVTGSSCQPQTERDHRGSPRRRRAVSTRPCSPSSPPATGYPATGPLDHRQNRHGQELACLRARTQGMP